MRNCESMILLPPSSAYDPSSLISSAAISTTTINNFDFNNDIVYQQLEQLQTEIYCLKNENEQSKISGQDLLDRAPTLISLPRRTNIVQETLEDIIKRQAQEIQRLRTELEREKTKCLLSIAQLEQTIITKENYYKKQLEEYETKTKQLNDKLKYNNDNYLKQVYDKDQELNNIKQLLYDRAYSPTIQTIETIKNEKHLLLKRLEQSEKQNQLLNKQMNLLNLKILSVTNILTVQEEQLEPIKSSSIEDKRQTLLNCWRKKVYDLLLQLKSMELILKNNRTKFSKDIEHLQMKVNNLLNENKLLNTQYDERKNHIQYVESKLEYYDNNLSSKTNENENLKQTIKEYEVNEKTIYDIIEKFQFNKIDILFKNMNKTLSIYEQRLNYINKRVELLNTKFSRQLSSSSSSSSSSSRASIALQTDEQQHYTDVNLLENELKTITNERDILAKKLHYEYDTSKQKTTELEKNYQNELAIVNEKMNMINIILQQNSEQIQQYEIDILDKDKQIQLMNEKYSNHEQNDNIKQDNLIEKLKHQFKEHEEILLNEKDQLEKELNAVKYEQTKILTNSRQLEQTTTREKERWQQTLADMQLKSDQELEKLIKRIMTLERERNSLTKTIQQEFHPNHHVNVIENENDDENDDEIVGLVSNIRQLATKVLGDASNDGNDA
ncbi:unnamed protein product [Didymodactylos carnosus]|uniref:Coiled-coil alpha-helical rod protein 1 n=1 Tax=Didymodactylos carnosus TaxID=1234261 RepID=A0A815GSL0_9BILA|nr:unnamed protein product [Didymodactylos carnosus]CAF4204727.1 unnamed protein product [Didymodactylos carnosus]